MRVVTKKEWAPEVGFSSKAGSGAMAGQTLLWIKERRGGQTELVGGGVARVASRVGIAIYLAQRMAEVNSPDGAWITQMQETAFQSFPKPLLTPA
jgi:hypothetical protein